MAKGEDLKLFLKQLLVISGVWTTYFMYGLCIGSPTVLIPQKRREVNSNDTMSEDMASWLSSVHGYSGAPGAIVFSIVALYLGRKNLFLPLSFCLLGSFLAFYFSGSSVHILTSEIILGFFVSGQLTISMFVATEYISPKYRGVFLALKGPSFFWGIWIANTIGTFFHWKKIALLGVVCSIYTTIIVIFWPESPYWLASRGRFYDSAISHRWLRGCEEAAEEELKELIAAEKERIKAKKSAPEQKANLRVLFKIIFSREFSKPILLCMLLIVLYCLSGKIVCAVYAIDIIKSITNSEDSAYIGMLSLDGITIFSLYLGSGLSKVLKRRTILLSSSLSAVIFLLTLSTYLYIVSKGLLLENKYISLFLLSLYTISISTGPLVMCTTIYGELISLKYRCSSMIMISIFGNIFMATLLKLGPFVFKTFHIHGTFLFYGVSSFLCIILLYKYLPETKDRTLQEIQDCLCGKIKKIEESRVLI